MLAEKWTRTYKAKGMQGTPVGGNIRDRETVESPVGRGAEEGEPETELLHGIGAGLLRPLLQGRPFPLPQGREIPDRQQPRGTSGETVHGIAESDPALRQRRGRGDGGGLLERGGHGEARGRVGMALPR